MKDAPRQTFRIQASHHSFFLYVPDDNVVAKSGFEIELHPLHSFSFPPSSERRPPSWRFHFFSLANAPRHCRGS